MTSSYIILLFSRYKLTLYIIFISQNFVHFNHIASNTSILRVGNFNLLSLSL